MPLKFPDSEVSWQMAASISASELSQPSKEGGCVQAACWEWTWEGSSPTSCLVLVAQAKVILFGFSALLWPRCSSSTSLLG